MKINKLAKTLAVAVLLSLPMMVRAEDAKKEGRFQLFNTPNPQSMTLLLDTQTGKIWQMGLFPLGENQISQVVFAPAIVSNNEKWAGIDKKLQEQKSTKAE